MCYELINIGMQIIYYFKHVQPNDQKAIRAYIKEKLPRLEEKLRVVKGAEVVLKVSLEAMDKHTAYRVTLDLKTPKEKYLAEEVKHDIKEAVDLSIDRIIKQILKREKKVTQKKQKSPRMSSSSQDLDFE